MNIQNQFSKVPYFLVCFILGTIPLVFGAVHPIVYASYTAIILTGLGGWLCLSHPFSKQPAALIPRGWLISILCILLFSALQNLPLPMTWLDIITPARALRVERVNDLAQTTQTLAPISEYGILGLTSTILLIALLIYFCGLKRLLRQNRQFFRVVYMIVIIVGVFEAVYGLFQFLSPRIGILWLPLTGGRAAHGTIIYKNQFASFLNMCWPLAAAAATIQLQSLLQADGDRKKKKSLRERLRRIDDKTRLAPLFIFATGIMLLSVLFSLSRGGIIAMLLVMILLNFFLPIGRKTKLLFLGLFALFVSAYGALLGLDTVISRFDSIGQSGTTRFGTYLASIPMLLDHAWTGIGFGSYALLSPVYLKGLSANILWTHSHSEYLQLMLEFGIPVSVAIFVCLIAAMFSAGSSLYKLINDASHPVHPSVIMAGGAYCGLMGLLIHGSVDFGWRLPANLFYAVTLAALVSYGLESMRYSVDTKK